MTICCKHSENAGGAMAGETAVSTAAAPRQAQYDYFGTGWIPNVSLPATANASLPNDERTRVAPIGFTGLGDGAVAEPGRGRSRAGSSGRDTHTSASRAASPEGHNHARPSRPALEGQRHRPLLSRPASRGREMRDIVRFPDSPDRPAAS